MYWPLNVPRVYVATFPSSANVPLNDYHQQPKTIPTPHEKLETIDGTEGDTTANVLGDPYDEDVANLLGDLADNKELVNGSSHKPDLVDKNHHSNLDDDNERDSSIDFLDAVETRDIVKRDILALRVARNGQLFATISEAEMAVWQIRPTVVVAHVVRSQQSLQQYGANVDLLIRPDSQIFVVQTADGYLITYSLHSDYTSKVYRPTFAHKTSQQGMNGMANSLSLGIGEGGGVREYNLRFRMVIKVDAGISRALAFDDELVVTTTKPSAVQCIRWTPDSGAGSQTSTELVSRMSWILGRKVCVREMIYDRPMHLSCWITSDGRAYAVQRHNLADSESTGKLFRGYCFHSPKMGDDSEAVRVAINARFSLLAVGTTSGKIEVYNARDYVGNIPLSHTLRPPVSKIKSGGITFLAWSPDGYAIFVGYEAGWALWSVYGKLSASSFKDDAVNEDRPLETYLHGVRDGVWLPGGGEMLLCSHSVDGDTVKGSDNIWMLEMARSAVTGLFNAANVARTVLITPAKLLIYRGHEQSALQTLSTEQTLWHNVPIPPSYLVDNYPIRHVVISSDGRYIAVAGRRGLAHYSINSGRWKTFLNESMENEFAVRGGMCWYHHILIAAIEAEDAYELRLYSRELDLDNSLLLHVETLPCPVILVSISGDDGVLVYTSDNALYHFIFTTTKETVLLKLVGQITFHGIVRAPARVRSISWILPDEQLRDGDPSQDVALATVVFLVDGKLVLLQPSTAESGELKYDMRVLYQNVEYYSLVRDLPGLMHPVSPLAVDEDGIPYQSLNNSLWVFDGQDVQVWMDIHDVLQSITDGGDLPTPVKVPVDFYPLSVLMTKGIISGCEIDLVQRRDVGFSSFRLGSRTHLFFQHLLRHHLTNRDEAAALGLAKLFEDVTYFEHALEVLLHVVLDDEADTQPEQEVAVLPLVVRFLSNFPEYLNVVVQCTRKTEVASWSYLFSVVGSPQVLFEDSLARGLLKTAGGYLLILHTMEKLSSSSQDMVRLFSRAVAEEDWDLCKELARFLLALDNSGKTLREALEYVDLRSPAIIEEESGRSFMFEGTNLALPGSRSALVSLSNSPFVSQRGSPDL